MHIISRKRLNEFSQQHPDTKAPLTYWYSLARHTDFANFVELRAVFPSADHVGKLTVFNIGGNKVRLLPRSTIIFARFTFAQCLLMLITTSGAGRNEQDAESRRQPN